MELLKSTVLSAELLAEIRKLYFQTNQLADQGIAGQYRSAFRGRGIEFEEVREYFPGDDVRSIDWKVTARSQKTYMKSYREERELTVMICVDVSASTRTATRSQLREELIAKVGAILTLIALRNNDKVGLVTFSNRLETYHPPRKARGSVWRILHEVLTPGVYHPGTDLVGLCSFLNQVLKRKAIIFIVSDFLTTGFEPELAVLSKRHDLTAVTVSDPADNELPAASLVSIRDPETGSTFLLDSSNPALRSAYQQIARATREEQEQIFRRHRIGRIELCTDRPMMDELKRYFSGRSKGRFRRASLR